MLEFVNVKQAQRKIEVTLIMNVIRYVLGCIFLCIHGVFNWFMGNNEVSLNIDLDYVVCYVESM